MTDEELLISVQEEIKRSIIGKDDVVRKVLCAILARGHVLIEDIPGLGKTTMAMAIASVCQLNARRLQFTPDVLPSDVVGFNLYDKETGSFRFVPGVIFTNLFLADEINRTSPKSQSALLEVMEEGNVTVDGNTYELEKPFIVLATQNPAGSAGTQLLPESQLDRFMIQLSMGYPKDEDEISILRSKHVPAGSTEKLRELMTKEQVLDMQAKVDQIFVHDVIYQYIVALITATRENPYLELGASPRAGIALMRMGCANAFMSGRDYVKPRDITDIFADVVRHRILLNSRARIEKRTKDQIIEAILASVEKPESGKAK
ncbi:MAG: MoxR family ATPase [Lachnospiraceae bacterium]|nr:MoxR family ATPase [Lachnospiraceae bacterium]